MAAINPEFSARLREAIKRKQMTQRDLARAVNVREVSISKYVNGGVPEWDILSKIALSLNVSIDWLLTGEGDYNPSMVSPRVASPPAPPPAQPDTGLRASTLRQMGDAVPPELAAAEMLQLEMAAWLRRQAMRQPRRWQALERALEDFRSRWENAGRESRERQPGEDDRLAS